MYEQNIQAIHNTTHSFFHSDYHSFSPHLFLLFIPVHFHIYIAIISCFLGGGGRVLRGLCSDVAAVAPAGAFAVVSHSTRNSIMIYDWSKV